MDWSTLLLVALMGGAVYFLMIRPQQKRTKEQANLMSSIAPGVRVMMISGIVGTIRYVGDKQAIIEISPGVEMTIDKRAISPQPVTDEFEYSDDADPHLVETAGVESTLVGGFPPVVGSTGEVISGPTDPAVASASDETDAAGWDSPENTKH